MRKIFLILFLGSLVAVGQVFIGGGTSPTKRRPVNRSLPAPPPLPSGGIYWIATNGTDGATGSFSDPLSFNWANTQAVLRATEFVTFKTAGTYSFGSTNFVVPPDWIGADGDPPQDILLFQIR